VTPVPIHENPQQRAARVARLAPLGLLRLRILSCLGGDTHVMPQYFATPGPDEDLFAAYRAFVRDMVERVRGEEDAYSLVAAARLVTGDLSAADDILNTLRAERFEPEHNTGFCVVIASTALGQVLPLPQEIAKPQPNYVAGSAEEAALRTWLAAHRDRLTWNEVEGLYSLSDA
jgi:hypothetical protein